jgi:hypothetical protein
MENNENWAINHFDELSRVVRKYNELTNSLLGALSVGAAISCASLDNPRIFAWLALAVFIPIWYSNIRPLKEPLNQLRAVNHPTTRLGATLLGIIPAVIGASALILVALGLLTKDGFMF